MLDDTSATSNAAAGQDPIEIVDQATLEQAIAQETAKQTGEEQPASEPAPEDTPKPESVKAEPVEDYRERYINMRKDYERIIKEKKALEEAKSNEEFKSKFQDLDYDQRLALIADELQQTKAKYSEFETKIASTLQQQVVQEDQALIDSYLTSDPELSNHPELHSIFKMYAMSDQLVDPSITGGKEIPWNQVKLEDIKTTIFKPVLEKVSARKVTVKEKPLIGSSPKVEDDLTEEAIEKMTPHEYEQNRAKIYKKYGIRT